MVNSVAGEEFYFFFSDYISLLSRGGSTETGQALKYILHKGFPGGRNSSVPEVLIIISDGKSQGSTAMPAMQVKERHITVFAVGIKFPR